MNNGLNTPDCIKTYTGIYVNVFNPTVDMISIEDIAHALSHQCRFSGHTRQFYSVAQHSILCSEHIDSELKLTALLHDAAEAYLVDVPSPVKRKLTNYKEIEDNVMRVIAEKFKIKFPFDKRIKEIDEMMLVKEWEQLMDDNPKEHFICLKPEEAKQKFLVKYIEISA